MPPELLLLAAFLAKEAAASSKESAQTLKDVEQLLTSEEEKKLFAAINAARKQFLAIRDQIYAAKKEGDAAKEDQLYQQQYVGIANNTQGAMRSLLDFERARIDEISADIQKDAASSQWQIFALEAVILACGIAFALLLTRSITGPLRTAERVAHEIADMNLSGDAQRHYGSDETGQLLRALDAMREALRQALQQVRGVVDNITTASSEIASGNADDQREKFEELVTLFEKAKR